MNLRDKYENGSTLSKEYVLSTIIRLGIIRRIPIFVFPNCSAIQFLNKLIPLHTQISKEKLKESCLSSEEWERFDSKIKELYDAPLWVYDIEIHSIEDYKSAEEVIVNEKVKYVFIDSLPDTIEKSELIKWSEEVGFHVYFTEFKL